MWDDVAARLLSWPQRLAIWALGVTVCGGAMAGLVGLVWYLVSRW